MNLNKVILIGRLGADPKTFTNAAGLSVATSESYQDASGTWKEVTEWHRVTVFKQLAERAAKFEKGDLVYCEGKQKTRKYTDNEGNERSVTEVIAFVCRQIVKKNAAPAAGSVQKPWANEFGTDIGEDGLPF